MPNSLNLVADCQISRMNSMLDCLIVYNAKRFIIILKFSVLEHFCWLGLSFLCLPAAALEEAFQHMTPTQIEMLRALPSMQKLVPKFSI